MVGDLNSAFSKLERVARERIAVTVATEFTPRGLKLIGSDADGASALGGYLPDHILAINLLFFKGAYPKLHYIDSYKVMEKTGFAVATANPASAAAATSPAIANPTGIDASNPTGDNPAAAIGSGTTPAAAISHADTNPANTTASNLASATTANPTAAQTAASPAPQLVRWAFITWEPTQ